MPKVATYQADQVLTNVTRQPRANASSGNAVFNSNIQAAQGVTKIAQAGFQIKQRVDTTSAEEALVSFERDKNNLFFNPENGYFNTQGKNAYDNANAANDSLSKLKKQYGESLNPNSKLMFDKSADLHITRSQSDIARHSSKGLKAWEVATIRSQVENTVENASLYWNQPDRLAVQNALGRQAVIDSAELEGIGAEATNERLQTYDSSFTKTAIISAISSSAEEGTAMMEEHGAKLEGPDKVKLDKLISDTRETEIKNEQAVDSLDMANQLVNTYDSMDDIKNEVDKIKDDKLRKMTQAEANTVYYNKKRVEKEVESNNYSDALDLINGGASSSQIIKSNPSTWNGMSASQRNSILAGKHQPTNHIEMNRILSLPQAELATVDMIDVYENFKPQDAMKIKKQIDKAKSYEPDYSSTTRNQKITKATEQLFGVKTGWKTKRSKKNTVKGDKADAFIGEINNALNEAAFVKKDDLTNTEIESVIADYTLSASREISATRTMFGFDILAFDEELTPDDIPTKDMSILNGVIDDNPKIDNLSLIKSYRYLVDNEKPVTIDNLKHVYNAGNK